MSAAQGWSRRALLGAGIGAPLAGGLPGIGNAATPRAPVADAHVHLFNASDLPVANFVKHVILYRALGGTPPRWARALIDFLAYCQKTLAVSVVEEEESMRGKRKRAARTLSPEGFARAAAALFEARMASDGDAAALGDDSLADSYRALLEDLAVDGGLAANTAQSLAGTRQIKREARRLLERVAKKAEKGDLPAPGAIGQAQDLAEPADPGCPSTDYPITLGSAARLIGWAYLLLARRERLIERYLKTYTTRGHAPKLLVNHLVDYDYWIGEGPARDSSHLGQARLAAKIAARFATRARIVTFAGFCPLRYAIESRTGGTPLFVEHKALVTAKAIGGFKLYPPMGFQPSCNVALAQYQGDSVFDPGQPGLVSPLRAWQRLPDAGSLAQALDDALDMLFGYCATNGLPVMAHAGPGNQLGRGFGDRANPRFWEPVVKKHAIRLSLGHLVNDATAFVEAHDSPKPDPDCVWALKASPALLDPTSTALRGTVYGDLAYMPELIDDCGLRKRFFEVLRAVYGRNDPDLTRILYGTDWLMLGHERHNDRYFAAMLRGMQDACYSPRQIDNILWANARAFIDGKPG